MKVLCALLALAALASASQSEGLVSITQWVSKLTPEQFEEHLRGIKNSTSLPYVPQEFFDFLKQLEPEDYSDIIFFATARDTLDQIRSYPVLQPQDVWSLIKYSRIESFGTNAMNTFYERTRESHGTKAGIAISWLIKTASMARATPNDLKPLNDYIRFFLTDIKNEFSSVDKAAVDTVFPDVSKLAEKVHDIPQDFNFLTVIPVYF